MSIHHAKPSEIISLQLDATLSGAKTTTLAKTAELELIRLILPAGKEIPTHRTAGEVTVQCLHGRVAFSTDHKTQELSAGQLLYLPAGEPHAVVALEDSSLLVTLLLKSKA